MSFTKRLVRLSDGRVQLRTEYNKSGSERNVVGFSTFEDFKSFKDWLNSTLTSKDDITGFSQVRTAAILSDFYSDDE